MPKSRSTKPTRPLQFAFSICGTLVALELTPQKGGSVTISVSVELVSGEWLEAKSLEVALLSNRQRAYNCVLREDGPILPSLGGPGSEMAFSILEFSPVSRGERPSAVIVTLRGQKFELDLGDPSHRVEGTMDLPPWFPSALVSDKFGEPRPKTGKGRRDKKEKKNGDDPRDTPPPTIFGEEIKADVKCCVRHFFVVAASDCISLQYPWFNPNTQVRERVFSVRGFVRIYGQFEGANGCSCHCCEYRQMIRGGFFMKSPRMAAWMNMPMLLTNNVILNQNIWQEDGTATDRVGHREDRQRPTDLYMSPDRATGCFYSGYDQPGLARVPAGWMYRIELEFVSMILDVCRQVVELPNVKFWDVNCSN